MPSAIHSPIELERTLREDGMASEALVRLLIVDDDGAVIGTIWHA